jgi:hypothetical protein
MPRPQELIAVAVRNLEREVPALAHLSIVVRLELRGRGDLQIFRVRLPAPEVSKGEPDDARLELAMSRSVFNRFAEKGRLADWREAFDRGEIRVTGDPEVRKLIGTVVERQLARAQLRKAR